MIRTVAILIGIRYLGTKNELDGCHNDTMSMYNLLNNEYGNTIDFLILADTDDKICGNNNNIAYFQPTKKNIERILNSVINDYDNYYFHFSGHGIQSKDRNGDELDGKDESILPVDFRENGKITDDYMYKNFISKLDSSCKVNVIMDCCHSGTMLDLPYLYNNSENKKNNTFIDTWKSESYMDDEYRKKRNLPWVISLSGCKDKEVSWDVTYNDNSNGALTWCFCKCYKNNKLILDIFDDVNSLLRDKNYDQHCMMNSSFIVQNKYWILKDRDLEIINNVPRKRKNKNNSKTSNIKNSDKICNIM